MVIDTKETKKSAAKMSCPLVNISVFLAKVHINLPDERQDYSRSGISHRI